MSLISPQQLSSMITTIRSHKWHIEKIIKNANPSYFRSYIKHSMLKCQGCGLRFEIFITPTKEKDCIFRMYDKYYWKLPEEWTCKYLVIKQAIGE